MIIYYDKGVLKSSRNIENRHMVVLVVTYKHKCRFAIDYKVLENSVDLMWIEI
jgi:hypothetical protein